jgi:hypothetical protein
LLPSNARQSAKRYSVTRGNSRLAGVRLRIKMQTIEERFWSKVDKRGPDECWEWTAGRPDGKYGRFFWYGKQTPAHRCAWESVNGSIPDGKDILHSCDNPPCCNPSHLRPGTNLENVHDRDNKGRGARLFGERNPRHKLRLEQVIEIRERYIPRKTSEEKLAKEYGVGREAISKIIRGENWNKNRKGSE